MAFLVKEFMGDQGHMQGEQEVTASKSLMARLETSVIVALEKVELNRHENLGNDPFQLGSPPFQRQ